MGIRILEGDYDGTTSGAVMMDSVTEWAFGPLFDNGQEAELFILWHSREYGKCVSRATQPQLADRFCEFRKLETTCAECGDWMLGGAICEDCQESLSEA
jgi:hypothetical protein